MTPRFDRNMTLLCAQAMVAAYEEDTDARAAILAASSLTEIAYIQGPYQARVLLCSSYYGVMRVYQGTQFHRGEIPNIVANLDQDIFTLAGGAGVHHGYYRLMSGLRPLLLGTPTPSLVLGHSEGGCLAELDVNTQEHSGLGPVLLTCGAPKCGDQAFWDAARVIPIRIEHEKDPAPGFPFVGGSLVQPAGAWWLIGNNVVHVDHRPSFTDMLEHWSDHWPENYVSALKALPA